MLIIYLYYSAAQSLHLTAGDEVRVFCPPASSAWCWLTWGGVPLCCPLLVPGGAESYTLYTSNTHANMCPPHTHTMLQGFIIHFRFVLTLKLKANPCPYIFKWISPVNAFKYDQDTRVLQASITIWSRTDIASNPLVLQISNSPHCVHALVCTGVSSWCVCGMAVVCWYVMCAGGGAA